MAIDEKNILEIIAEKTRERVEEAKRIKPPETVHSEALAATDKLNKNQKFRLENTLKASREAGKTAFICEVKKASPSKGLIAKDFDYINIAKEYQNAGAAAISVLTEPYFFKGSNKYLEDISKNVQIPLLRKDFTIDEYQLCVARLIGASAVLLIASLLNERQIKNYMHLADTLGLCCVVEAHTETEVQSALRAGTRILGVNNRNLKTFEVDLNTTLRLKKGVPDDVLFISESGIKTYDDIKKLQDNGVTGVLIGETLMKSEDKTKMLKILRGEN